MPLYSNVKFIVVDFVTGTINDSNAAAIFTGIDGVVLVASDIDHNLTNYFYGLMSKTVVIDANGVVLLNEDFKTGSNLISTLQLLP